MSVITDFASRAGSAAQSIWEASGQLIQPSLRLGVTGLARSGKTVFTTALVHHLTRGTNLPAFRASAAARKKIEAAGGRALTLLELAVQNPKGSGVRIMG